MTINTVEALQAGKRRERLVPRTSIPKNDFSQTWKGSSFHQVSTLHQLSPYVGKMKPSIAKALISAFTHENEIVFDPFSGSGTVVLEAWIAGRKVIANDLSPYAAVITQAKLFPPCSLDAAMSEISDVASEVLETVSEIDLRKVPKWVRAFFHPVTLRETLAWFHILKEGNSNFLLACLLGILHHQRPGFLSYPCSHRTPYLRERKFPRNEYPELYQYRSVQDRLERKVERSLRRVPPLDENLMRECHSENAAKFRPRQKVHAIITSPPYMSKLDYGRDNRLRLWFLGTDDWKSLNLEISPKESIFLSLFRTCLNSWRRVLVKNGVCVLVLGDSFVRAYRMRLHEAISYIATYEVGGYALVGNYSEELLASPSIQKGPGASRTEIVLVLRNEG